jgi:tetratricopeptide (TPR) repeat protein
VSPHNHIPCFGASRAVQLVKTLTFVIFFLALTACSTQPTPPHTPAIRAQAQADEAQGVKQFAKADYASALLHFAQAQRLYQSTDDLDGIARNQLYRARAELALDRNTAAMDSVRTIPGNLYPVETMMVQFQSHLALGEAAALSTLAAKLNQACNEGCPFFGSVQVLLARAGLMEGNGAVALTHSRAALKFFAGKNETRETANAWRIAAAALLGTGNYSDGLDAAQQALVLDRQQALPEKIARDWLLIADIQRKQNSQQSRASYERALAIARAANLTSITTMAEKALKESTP